MHQRRWAATGARRAALPCSCRAATSRRSASVPSSGAYSASKTSVDGQAATVMLSFDYWTTAFGADPAVLGKTLVVGGQPLEIVGVAPRGFVGTTPGARPERVRAADARMVSGRRATPIIENRFFATSTCSAGLKPGVSLEQAQARSTRRSARSSTTSRLPLAAAGAPTDDIEEFRART